MVKVTFDTEGGVIEDNYTHLNLVLVDGTVDIYECDFNAYNNIKELPIPTKENFVFIGWYTGTTINDSQWFNNSTISSDITLYARWQEPTYLLEVVSNDYTLGFPQYATGKYGVNENILLVAKPFKDNAFVGWYDENDTLLSTRYNYSITKKAKPERIVAKFTDKYPLFELDARDNNLIVVGYEGEPSEIIIPAEYNGKTVIQIEKDAFNGCSSLTSITIPDSIKKIGEYAFYKCSGLTSMVIPDSVESIGNFAFGECNSLENIILPFVGASKDATAYDATFGYIFGYTTTKSNSGDYRYNIPNSSTVIYASTDYYDVQHDCVENAIWQYTHISYVGARGNTGDSYWYPITIRSFFYYIPSSIKNVVITSATKLQVAAFKGCENIESITLNNTLIDVKERAFEGCTGLTSIIIPDSVTSIAEGAFSGCNSLESVTLPFVGGSVTATSAQKSTLFGYIFGINSYTGGVKTQQYYASDSYTTYYIPSRLKSVTIIGGNILYGAFYNCSNLTNVTIGDGVTSMGESVFYNCSSLTYSEKDNVKYLGNEQNPYHVAVEIIDNTATSLIIVDECKLVASRAFYNCTNLTNVTIGNGVTSIGSHAFYGCSKLTSVNISSIESWCGIAFSMSSSSYSANPLCYAKNLYLNGELVTNLIIPDSVTSICEGAFYGYSSLTSIVIPDSVESIGSYAFRGCTNLTSVTIGNSVTSIGSYAFNGCSSLTSVYYEGTATEWSDIIISPYNTKLTDATRYYYSETEPITSGNYWHHVDGVVTIW